MFFKHEKESNLMLIVFFLIIPLVFYTLRADKRMCIFGKPMSLIRVAPRSIDNSTVLILGQKMSPPANFNCKSDLREG